MGFLKWWGLSSIIFFFWSCSYKEKKNEKAINSFKINEIRLGKALFFFKGLSGDQKQNCASCHRPDSGFASARQVFSNGVVRNVPGLLNLKSSKHFFWDGREKNLESLVIKPILNPDEMQGNLVRTIARMNQSPKWKLAFKQVYGKDTIYTALISRSLSAYIRSLERHPAKRDSSSQILNKGLILFQAHCEPCHSGKYLSDFSLRKSVVAASGVDSGHFCISHQPEDIYSFKTPGLVSLSLTAPYMHDGRFSTLSEVVDAYTRKLEKPELDKPESKKALLFYLQSL